MWGTALSTSVKIDKKEEWDRLDIISKWLIAMCSMVTNVTIYSCAIAGLLAARFGQFAFLP
jgi:1,4-dihydroxy-2-naphthoate octaprenyltransferase